MWSLENLLPCTGKYALLRMWFRTSQNTIIIVVVVVLSFYRTKIWIRSIQRNIMKKGVVVFNVKQRRMELDLSREQHMLKYYVSDNLYFLKKSIESL